jgi:hypothetical protein
MILMTSVISRLNDARNGQGHASTSALHALKKGAHPIDMLVEVDQIVSRAVNETMANKPDHILVSVSYTFLSSLP